MKQPTLKASFSLLAFLLTLPACSETNGGSNRTDGEAANKKAVQEAVNALAEDPALKKGRIAFLARGLKSGERIAAHRSEELIVPASSQKLVTTIAALEILGQEQRFRTILGYRGRIEDGTLKGDLILQGGGDPAFLSEEFPEHYGSEEELFGRLFQACRNAGIQKVEGRVLVDARYFPYNTLSRSRIWEDMGNYFGAFPCGMNIMDNAFTLRFRTPQEAGEASELLGMSPDIPWLTIENRVRSSQVQEDRAYIFGKPYDSERIVEGTLPSGQSSYEIEGSLPDPARVAAWKLHDSFEENGLPISGGYSTYRLEGVEAGGLEEGIDTVRSPRVGSIVRETNFHSKNLFAEALLLEMGKVLGAEAKPRPSAEKLLERIGSWGMDIEGIRLEDGSGLAPTNRVTASFLVELLEKAWKDPYRGLIKSSLPVAGKSGTMSYVGAGTAMEGRVWAKSGYMSGVRAYAGYAKGRDGTMKAFALIANGFTCSASEMREKMEQVMVSLVE